MITLLAAITSDKGNREWKGALGCLKVDEG